VAGAADWVKCDALLMSGGYTPSVHLHSQARGKLRWDEATHAFVPGAAAAGCRSVGACNGLIGAELVRVFEQATAAAADALRECGIHDQPGAIAISKELAVSEDRGASGGWIGALPQPAGAKAGKAFVDWQNDVTAADLKLAVREGFRSIEHIKRYTTTGMATDQGKTSNLNALAIAAQQLGRAIPEVGLTTFRLPYLPVGFGGLAGYARGDFFAPVRKTPMYDWAAGRGAVFEPVAMWQRARYFPERGEDMHQAVRARMRGGAPLLRNLRRFHAWQDRGRRTRCDRIHEPHVRQQLELAGCRSLPLRHPAARRRLRVRRRRGRAPAMIACTSPRRPAARHACWA
jgi:sarcosine oxidase subunit alpha